MTHGTNVRRRYVQQQACDALLLVGRWMKNMGLAETQVKRLTPLRMFVQQVAEATGRFKVGGRLGPCNR